MFRSIAFRFITLSLGLAGGLLAQGAPCPDQVIEKVETRVTTLMPQVCGTNLSTTIGGVQISTQQNVCPLLVVIRPGHDTTIERLGSGTYTRPVKTMPILSMVFECDVSWLMGIIPIEVSSRCVSAGRTIAGAFTHYEQLSCDGGTTGMEIDEPIRLRPARLRTEAHTRVQREKTNHRQETTREEDS